MSLVLLTIARMLSLATELTLRPTNNFEIFPEMAVIYSGYILKYRKRQTFA